MKKFLSKYLTIAILLLFSSYSQAIVISLDPAVTQAENTDAVSLDLTVSGLGNGIAPSVGDFDIDVLFDNTVLSFVDYTLGTALGDIGFFEAADFSLGDLGGGLFNLAEVSFLTAAELNANQGNTIVLATLNFIVDSLAVGESTIVAIDTVYAIGDENGLPLEIDATNNALISNGNRIPEPSALLLFGLGLISLKLRRFLM